MHRHLPWIAVALLIAGCGSSSNVSSPKASPTARVLAFHAAPRVTINPHAVYTATLVTSDGSLGLRLLPKVAPVTVNNFVFLARHHFYDGVLFHRIIKGFMVQTGDPTGTGTGGPGYTIPDEKVTMPYTVGTVAMANTGRAHSGGSQFFIIVAARYPLAPHYTIFGQVISGMKTLERIASTPVGPQPANPQEISYPLKTVTLKRVTIHESRK